MMATQRWDEKNQKYLVDKIGDVKLHLKKHISKLEGKSLGDIDESFASTQWNGDVSPAIESLAKIFGLSEFEKFCLLLCAGMELDCELPRLCAKAQGNPDNTYPTFGLALAVFPKSHWSALAPISPLRFYRLLDLTYFQNTTITNSPIRIEERILHYLTGVSYLDKQLHGLVRPLGINLSLTESQTRFLEKIISSLKTNKKISNIQLYGVDETSKQILAKKICNDLGLDLWQVPAELIPAKYDEMESFVTLWRREAALLGACLYVLADNADPLTLKTVSRFLDANASSPLFLATRERLPDLQNQVLAVEIKKPERNEQFKMWKKYLGGVKNAKLDGEISRIVSQFDLNAYSIHAAASETLSMIEKNGMHNIGSILWQCIRDVSVSKMDGLAQKITPKATMDDLVLPVKEKQILNDMIVQIRNKDKVYREWGFEDKISRGLGITSLFAGESGTGKTMAAEVIANKLNLDLFHIDLSMVINKYIGETEKNIRRVFDAAEDGGSVLFFDEADALFGKRSEVHDSHDRYANIEVGYLLQRLESFKGLAILATNNKNSIDNAFLRRIRFVVNFPFPEEKSRAEIWRRAFPKSTPVNSLDYERLSKLNITGGHIRNIALNASFLAAEQGTPVSMTHLKRAAQAEYDKLERPLTKIESGDW